MIAYGELRIILSLNLVQSHLQLRPLDQSHPLFTNRIEGKSKVRVKLQAKNGCAFIIKAIEIWSCGIYSWLSTCIVEYYLLLNL